MLAMTLPAPPAALARQRERDAAPSASVPAWRDLRGNPRRLQEWRGRPVLLNYWATWCGPCLKEMPELQAFSKSEAGVQVVGVALDEAASVKAYLGRVPVAYPILIETAEPGEPGSSGHFGNRQGVLPYSVLLDARGRVLKTKAGPVTRQELQAWLLPPAPQR